MSIIALSLYGSCARNDQDDQSDVDLFALTTDSEYRMSIQNNVNLASYPFQKALERASSGDLFLLHIIMESVSIYDHAGAMKKLKDAFAYKDSYAKEIKEAADTAWFLLRWFDSFSNYSFVNKRMAWCVRTMLIAKSAELRSPVFSANDLALFSGGADVLKIIKNKSCENKNSHISNLLEAFLIKNDFRRPVWIEKSDFTQMSEAFLEDGRVIAAKTVEALLSDSGGHSYV